jgi:hypothetical protein
MSELYMIYGGLQFPKGKLAEWREQPIADDASDWTPMVAPGIEFEPTTVGAVIDAASDFGWRYGQLLEVEESGDKLAIRACLVDGTYSEDVKPIATALRAAAAYGAQGEVRFSAANGSPDVLTVGSGKAKIHTPRTPPTDDADKQTAILQYVGELAARKKPAKKPAKKPPKKPAKKSR